MGNLWNNGAVGLGIVPSYAFSLLDVVDTNSTTPMRIGADVTSSSVNFRVGADNTHRYLSVHSEGTAAGLECGGLLVSDGYGYSNPSPSSLVIKGSVGIGSAVESNIALKIGGLCKAKDLSLSSKATSAATVATDSGTTLVTKGFADTYLAAGSSSLKFTPYMGRNYHSLVSTSTSIQTLNFSTSTQSTNSVKATPTSADFVFGLFGIDNSATTEIVIYAGSTATASLASQRLFGIKKNAANFVFAPAIVSLKQVATNQMGFYYNYSATPSTASFCYLLGYFEST